MRTRIVAVDPERPLPAAIEAAANVVRGGGLVAFPTETVYGLGANALDATAVARIFAAKGRPATNPVIVHVENLIGAQKLTTSWPESATRLAARFWPGPLTLVLTKQPVVPDVTTAGGPTVAIRVPSHPVALSLIRVAGVPIAAPSANRSTEVSPTLAEHVLRALDGRIELLLDGGPTANGLESTVLDLSTEPPRLLRPGPLTRGELEAVLGQSISIVSHRASEAQQGSPLPSPGMLARHYAPHTPLELAADSGRQRVIELCKNGKRVGWLAFENESSVGPAGSLIILMPPDAARYGARLYAALHELDQARVDRIVVALPPKDETWAAIQDRLQRAAAQPDNVSSRGVHDP